MFTGIIETLGKVQAIEKEGSNYHFNIASDCSDELQVDQSVAHNGVCLTVINTEQGMHRVTAIEETMNRTTLGALTVGSSVNVERCVTAQSRLDGHIVQGHVDITGICESIKEIDGSWYFKFRYKADKKYILVDKGSIAVNGVSLTVIEPTLDSFSVAIIPYTYEHTSFKNLSIGDKVNLEFDVLGKYIAKYLEVYSNR